MSELETYKGYKISVNQEGEFTARQEGEDICSADTLKAVKTKLDSLVKATLNIPAYTEARYAAGSYVKGRITSCREKESYSGRRHLVFRFVYDKREKHDSDHWVDAQANNLFKDTKKNQDTIASIKQLAQEIREREPRMAELHKSLEAFTEEELMKPKAKP